MNQHASDVEIYRVEPGTGNLQKKTDLVGTTNNGGLESIFDWDFSVGKGSLNLFIGTQVAIKIRGGEWIYVGKVYFRDWLLSDTQVQFRIQDNLKVVKEYF